MREYGRDKDKLGALADIAEVFHASNPLCGKCLAGLWQAELIHGLCWSFILDFLPVGPTKDSSSISILHSWSWASQRLRIQDAFELSEPKVTEHANVIETDMDSDNPYRCTGLDAYLTLEAKGFRSDGTARSHQVWGETAYEQALVLRSSPSAQTEEVILQVMMDIKSADSTRLSSKPMTVCPLLEVGSTVFNGGVCWFFLLLQDHSEKATDMVRVGIAMTRACDMATDSPAQSTLRKMVDAKDGQLSCIRWPRSPVTGSFGQPYIEVHALVGDSRKLMMLGR